MAVRDLQARYGQVRALHGAALEVQPGELVAIIGPNGAGKTSLLNAIMGLLPATGSVLLDGEELSGVPTEQRVWRGMTLVPERRQLFGSLSVRDNLLLGAFHRRREGAGVAADMEFVFAHFPVLRERQRQIARTLSGGEQQMLAIGRGLMSAPRLLMMDEPLLGLAPLVVREILEVVRALSARGLSILLVEQNAKAALAVADRAYVMERGTVVLHGSASRLAGDPKVQAAYLGGHLEEDRG
ncbi:MAG: ABC transporter ATP-binding protein [Armatimonadota bacterium]|nr:ABC transporter ATP-binding protein [Armatimonadota bacterium]MDR5696431.1 ABC transporter ATP-binding protein [Armatimonadota bacterium]